MVKKDLCPAASKAQSHHHGQGGGEKGKKQKKVKEASNRVFKGGSILSPKKGWCP